MYPHHPSRRDILKLGGALAANTVFGGIASAEVGQLPEKEITADEVRQAIEQGANYLKEQQLKDGSWPDQPHYGGGLSPLCTLALLHAGCDLKDEVIRKAMAHLRAFQPTSTYAASLQTMVFCMAEPAIDRLLILRNAKWLESRQIKDGDSVGMWSVLSENSLDHTDNSMTHFAMLALYEAERIGITTNDDTWRLALKHWQKSQNLDGSWGWGPNNPGSGSMTCAGIAAITIASGRLSPGDATVEDDRINCCRDQQVNPFIECALAWLSRNFSVHGNPNFEYWLSYYLYSLERAGRMTAHRFIGQHDWYREGARMLVNSEQFSGAWPSDYEFNHISDLNVSTSFSLMFLSKGRWPVVVAHLKHEPAHDWNRHRSALFNLVSYVEKAWEKNLTSQIVDIATASVDDLLESPVLYISGREAPQFSDEEKQKLKQYVELGGFIFAVRCCGGTAFDEAFRNLMREIIPDSKLQPLPADHPVWYMEEPVDLHHSPELWGIDVSCRTGVIYCPQDLSCHWELARVWREQQYSPLVQEQIKAARTIGLNVLAYATNREVKFKNPALLVSPADEQNSDFERGKLYLAYVCYPGACTAAKGALFNLLRVANRQYKINCNSEPRKVQLSDPSLFNYHMVFLQGRSPINLSADERANLRMFLDRSGTIFADAICSSQRFTDSFREEMKSLLPGGIWEKIPVNDPLFTAALGGEDLSLVSRRESPKVMSGHGPLKAAITKTEPYLEGLKVDNRYAVIFSPYDISCALSGQESLEYEGYVRQDAAKIAMNVLLYTMHQ